MNVRAHNNEGNVLISFCTNSGEPGEYIHCTMELTPQEASVLAITINQAANEAIGAREVQIER